MSSRFLSARKNFIAKIDPPFLFVIFFCIAFIIAKRHFVVQSLSAKDIFFFFEKGVLDKQTTIRYL